MNGSKDVSVDLIQEVIKTGNAIGFKETMRILVELRNNNSTSVFQDSVELIVNEVLLHFKMTKPQLLDKKGDSRLARRFCYKLLHHFLNVEIRFLTTYFRRSDKSVYLEMKLFNNLDRQNKVDILVLNKYDIIFEKVEKKISK